jgi:hypothetical protein
MDNIYAETAAAEAWLIVIDEMVKVMREGNTAWALGFLNGGEVAEL